MKNKPKPVKAAKILPLFKNLYSRIAPRKKKQMYLLIEGMVIAAVVETVTLGLIAFFISSLSSPERAMSSRYVETVKEMLPWGLGELLNTPESFILTASIAVFVFIILKNVCLALVKYASVRYSASLQAFFGDLLLQNFLQAEYSWYVKENPANLVNSVNWRVHVGRFFQSLFQMATDLFLVIVVLAGLFLLQPVLYSSPLRSVSTGNRRMFVTSTEKVLSKRRKRSRG